MKIAILYICTDKYDIFWKDFYLSFEKFFLPQSNKHYYVFTDAEHLFDEENNERIHRIYQEPYPWPYSTLKRYHIFMPYLSVFENYDYIFFMNANILCCSTVTEEEVLPRKQMGESLTVVLHPYFYNKKPKHFTYDRNPSSTAFIPYSCGKHYICGGVNGGTASAFCSLIRQIDNQIESDLEHNIIALWHDESHINKYILDRTDYRILSPSYCYPEGAHLPYPPILTVREKSKWIPVNQIKNSRHTFTKKIIQFLRRPIKHLFDDIHYLMEKMTTHHPEC